MYDRCYFFIFEAQMTNLFHPVLFGQVEKRSINETVLIRQKLDLPQEVSSLFPDKIVTFGPLTEADSKIVGLKLYSTLLFTLGLALLSSNFRLCFNLFTKKVKLLVSDVSPLKPEHLLEPDPNLRPFIDVDFTQSGSRVFNQIRHISSIIFEPSAHQESSQTSLDRCLVHPTLPGSMASSVSTSSSTMSSIRVTPGSFLSISSISTSRSSSPISFAESEISPDGREAQHIRRMLNLSLSCEPGGSPHRSLNPSPITPAHEAQMLRDLFEKPMFSVDFLRSLDASPRHQMQTDISLEDNIELKTLLDLDPSCSKLDLHDDLTVEARQIAHAFLFLKTTFHDLKDDEFLSLTSFWKESLVLPLPEVNQHFDLEALNTKIFIEEGEVSSEDLDALGLYFTSPSATLKGHTIGHEILDKGQFLIFLSQHLGLLTEELIFELKAFEDAMNAYSHLSHNQEAFDDINMTFLMRECALKGKSWLEKFKEGHSYMLRHLFIDLLDLKDFFKTADNAPTLTLNQAQALQALFKKWQLDY